jgi:SOS-response transcriptional repressor LexA
MDEEELRDLGVSTHAGFPNAAVGSANKQLDMTELLIKHPSATYLMKLDSDEWNSYGMFTGDIVVVDRAVEPRDIDTVVWWDHDQFVISLKSHVPHNTATWGTVTSVIHQFRRAQLRRQ